MTEMSQRKKTALD